MYRHHDDDEVLSDAKKDDREVVYRTLVEALGAAYESMTKTTTNKHGISYGSAFVARYILILISPYLMILCTIVA